MRDGKLCGYVFSQLGKGVTWGYMLPIEPVFEAISNYWHHHYQQECYPKIAETRRISELDPGLGLLRNSRCSSTLSEDDKCRSNKLPIGTKIEKPPEDAPEQDFSLASQPGMSLPPPIAQIMNFILAKIV